MKKYGTAIILAVVLAALVVPVCTAAPKPKEPIGSALAPAVLVFGEDSPYNNKWQLPDAVGSVQVDQLSDKKSAVFSGEVWGLYSNTTYRVWIDMDGLDWIGDLADPATVGPLPYLLVLVQFTTDDDGHATWTATVQVDAVWSGGSHTISVLINPITPNATQLVSDNLTFSLNP